MKWTYVIQQKLKVALLLGCIMLLIIVTNLLSRRNIDNINKSFNSIYEDRLIPATDLFHLSDNLQNRRLLMERFLLNKEERNTLTIRKSLQVYSQNIDSLILKYEGTYLTQKESSCLSNLKHQLSNYEKVEESILRLSDDGLRNQGQKLYESKGDKMIMASLMHLKTLARIQFEVGRDLVKNSETIITDSDSLSSFQIIISIVIGLIIQGFIISSKVINLPKEKFNLN